MMIICLLDVRPEFHFRKTDILDSADESLVALFQQWNSLSSLLTRHSATHAGETLYQTVQTSRDNFNRISTAINQVSMHLLPHIGEQGHWKFLHHQYPLPSHLQY